MDEAHKQVDWLLAREPQAADLQAMKASIFEQQGLVHEMLAAAKQAVKLEPHNAGYHFGLANILAKLGRLDEASAEFNQSVHLDPNNLNFRLQLTNSMGCVSNPYRRSRTSKQPSFSHRTLLRRMAGSASFISSLGTRPKHSVQPKRRSG